MGVEGEKSAYVEWIAIAMELEFFFLLKAVYSQI